MYTFSAYAVKTFQPCRALLAFRVLTPKRCRFRCLNRKPLRFRLYGLRFEYLDLKIFKPVNRIGLKVKGLGVIA